MNARDLQIALYNYNVGIQRARDEYTLHPFMDNPCGTDCASRGCPTGTEIVAKRRKYFREYRQKRRAEGRKS